MKRQLKCASPGPSAGFGVLVMGSVPGDGVHGKNRDVSLHYALLDSGTGNKVAPLKPPQSLGANRCPGDPSKQMHARQLLLAAPSPSARHERC